MLRTVSSAHLNQRGLRPRFPDLNTSIVFAIIMLPRQEMRHCKPSRASKGENESDITVLHSCQKCSKAIYAVSGSARCGQYCIERETCRESDCEDLERLPTRQPVCQRTSTSVGPHGIPVVHAHVTPLQLSHIHIQSYPAQLMPNYLMVSIDHTQQQHD